MSSQNENFDKLSDVREEISSVDKQIVELLNKRMQLALAAGAIKMSSGMETLDIHREGDVLTEVSEINPGPITDDEMITLYMEFMRISRRIQNMERTEPGSTQGKHHPQLDWYIPSLDYAKVE